MSRKTSVLAVILAAVALPARGQKPEVVREPEYLGTILCVDSNTAGLIPLERQSVQHSTKVRALGLGGVRSSMKVYGEKSTVRFRQGQKLEFVVLAPSHQTDPQSLAKLYGVVPDDGMRQLATGGAGLGGGSFGSADGAVAIDASKYGRSSFRITPSRPLPPGEYMFLTSAPVGGVIAQGGSDGFCFAVDRDPSLQLPPLERVVPFVDGQVIPLNLVESFVNIESVEITSWPRPESIQARPDEIRSGTAKFTVANRDRRDWKCRFSVAILDEKEVEIASGEREVNLDGQDTDSDRVSLRVKAADSPRAAKIRIRILARPKKVEY